jgi:hypothetical protein
MDLRVALPDHQQRAQCKNSVRQHTMPRKSLKSTHATEKYSLRGTRFPAVLVLHRLHDLARPKALKLDSCSHFTHHSLYLPRHFPNSATAGASRVFQMIIQRSSTFQDHPTFKKKEKNQAKNLCKAMVETHRE